MTDDEIQQLAQYNAERSRGLMHRIDYTARMSGLQLRWNELHDPVGVVVSPTQPTKDGEDA